MREKLALELSKLMHQLTTLLYLWISTVVVYINSLSECILYVFNTKNECWRHMSHSTTSTFIPVRNEQICKRSVLTKTDQLQTTLSSADSCFSLLETLSLNTRRDVKTANEKQTNNRSADYLEPLQMICNTLKPKDRYYWWNSDCSFVIQYVSDPTCYSIRED